MTVIALYMTIYDVNINYTLWLLKAINKV